MLIETVLRPKRLASVQLGTQISICFPRMLPPVSVTVYWPEYEPAPRKTWLPNRRTLRSAAIIPRLTPPPVAVRPFKQYAVATKDPRLAAVAFAALTETVSLTNLVSGSGFVLLVSSIDVSVLGCDSFAILRTFSGLDCCA